MPRASRAHEDGQDSGGHSWTCPVASSPGPQGGPRVTGCDEEEDTRAGHGPARAALVSLLGSWPPRQVQETDRQGEAEQAHCSPQ